MINIIECGKETVKIEKEIQKLIIQLEKELSCYQEEKQLQEKQKELNKFKTFHFVFFRMGNNLSSKETRFNIVKKSIEEFEYIFDWIKEILKKKDFALLKKLNDFFEKYCSEYSYNNYFNKNKKNNEIVWNFLFLVKGLTPELKNRLKMTAKILVSENRKLLEIVGSKKKLVYNSVPYLVTSCRSESGKDYYLIENSDVGIKGREVKGIV